MLWRGQIKYFEVFQMVLDSYIEATESSAKMAIDCNGNLDTQLILDTLI